MDILEDLVRDYGFFVVLFGAITLWALISAIKEVAMRGSAERTRREIAAYIAEGSMTPEQGERLLRAKPKKDDWC